jgi:para-aminobenzoate synthetase component 1
LNTFKILDKVDSSGKPYIIYKKPKGFDLFTNFSKKITLSKYNIHKFFKSISSNKKKIKKNDLYVGFLDMNF